MTTSMFNPSDPNIICGFCQVGKVKQEGAVMKCQNHECKAETPIDINQAIEAQRLSEAAAATQRPNEA